MPEAAIYRSVPGHEALSELYAPIRHDLQRAEQILDAELASDLPFIDELTVTVRAYRGKMLRPALLLLSGRASGSIADAHHTLAAVVELVHLATLVHDDVLDEAEQRRRQPTIRSMAGNVAAVLVGDFLISHAFHLCSSLDSQYASRRIGAATNTVCEGELLQNRRDGGTMGTTDEYLEIIRRKTGALTAVACELGAHSTGADEATTAALHRYGLSVGTAFQIIDDVLDLAGDEDEVGKTLGQDFALGKCTLPLIHAAAHGGPEMLSLLKTARDGNGALTRDDLRARLDRTGSLDYAVNLAENYVADAIDELNALPPSAAKSSLAALAEFVIRRRF